MTQPFAPDELDAARTRTRQRVATWLVTSQLLLLLTSPSLLSYAAILALSADCGGCSAWFAAPANGLGAVLGLFILPLATLLCVIGAWRAFQWGYYAAAAAINALPVLAAIVFGGYVLSIIG